MSSKIVFYILFLFSFAAYAEPKVVATVDQNEVGLGDSFTLTISVNSDSTMSIGDHRLPQLDGLDLISQFPMRESRSVYNNGKFEYLQTQKYNYVFQTNKMGTIVIPPVEMVVNNKAYKTSAITVTVKDPGSVRAKPQKRARPQPTFPDEEGEDPLDEAEAMFNQLLQRHGINQPRGAQPNINPNDAFFLQLEVDKNEAYVGEQVTASWYIYTRNQIQNIDTLKYPNLKSFLKEDIEIATKLDFQEEVVNGIPYRKALLVSYALFPMREGVAVVDSYKARCTVLMGNSIFGGNSYTFSKASQEAKIKVKAVPATQRPSDYAGGVGQFTMKSSVDSINVSVNQPFPLRIRLEGRGNAKSIDLPTLNLPPTLEEYSRRDESKYNRDGTSYKEFEILLIPRQAGTVEIPALNMSFFDPRSGRFYKETTSKIALQVGAGKGGATPSAVNPSAREAAPQPANQLPNPIVVWESYSPSQFQTLIWVVVYLLVFIFLGWRARVELKLGQKKRSLLYRMSKRFKVVRAKVEAGDWRGVGTEGLNTTYFVLGELAGETGGSSNELEKMWSKIASSVRREFESPLRQEITNFETLSFAPEHVVGSLKEKSQMTTHVNALESLLKKLVQMATKATTSGKDKESDKN
ncbi:MAG: BatD family protein [Bdellovibrionales bacterium]